MLVRINMKTINVFHIFVIGTLLLAIGLMRDNTHLYVYYSLLCVTFGIFILVPLPSFTDITSRDIVRGFHYVFLLPILLYASYMGIVYRKMNSNIYDSYGGIGLFIMIYHSYKFAMRSI
jgi:hypothetical protein